MPSSLRAEIQGHGLDSMHTPVVLLDLSIFNFGNAIYFMAHHLLCEKDGNLVNDTDASLANQSTLLLPGTLIGLRRNNQNPSAAYAWSLLYMVPARKKKPSI